MGIDDSAEYTGEDESSFSAPLPPPEQPVQQKPPPNLLLPLAALVGLILWSGRRR